MSLPGLLLADHTGLWIENGKLRNVIHRNSLAGVCLYWSKLGRRKKVYSLELIPTGPIDQDDPVLWALVRDEEPLRPGLPRLRHRLAVCQSCVGRLDQAASHWATALT